MKFKFNIVIVLLAVISINSAQSSKFTCSLDDMKLFAAEACENIFVENDPNTRDKREIWTSKYGKNRFGDGGDKTNTDKYFTADMVRIRRKDYPHGGFLKIKLAHAKVLTHKDNDYRIVHRKMHSKTMYSGDVMKKSIRGKRENVESFVNIPYCCTNNCRTDFFCRR